MPGKIKKPPRLAKNILERLLPAYFGDTAIGDYDEIYNRTAEKEGVFRANLWYWKQVIISLPAAIFWGFVMLKNYITIALRNIIRHKEYSLINIVGLTVSLAIGFIIIQLINVSYDYDKFHEKKDRIYRVVTHHKTTQKEVDLASAPLPLGTQLLNDCPGIEKMVRMKAGFAGKALYKKEGFNINTLFVDEGFFDVFTYKLAHGNPAAALIEPYSIILTHELAKKLFAENKNPVGEVVSIEGAGDFRVTGVLQDTTGLNSHLDIRPLISASTIPALEKRGKIQPCLNDWDRIWNHYIYFLLAEDVSPDRVEAVLPKYAESMYLDADYSVKFRVQPLMDILPGNSYTNHPGTAFPMVVIYLLSGVAIIVALIAAFNYTNLSIARALSRSKEVGIRKVVGAKRSQLFLQFSGEAVIISLIALFFAYLFYKAWLFPAFMNLHPLFAQFFDFKENFRLIAFFTGFAILTGIFAGIFPALYMSRFNPVKVLKDLKDIKLFSKITLRKVLIVFQFALSLVFIISAVVAYYQLRYFKTMDAGFSSENIINVVLKGTDYQLYKQEVSGNANILSISASDKLPGTAGNSFISILDEKSQEFVDVPALSVDPYFIENLNMELAAGKNFPKTLSRQREQFVILNERAAEWLGFEQPGDAVGQSIIYKNGTHVEIIGIVRDFSQDKLQHEVRPCVLRFVPGYFQYANIRINPVNTRGTITFLRSKWKKINPDQPFTYRFFTEQVEEHAESMQIMMNTIRFLAILTLFVSCLGLMGIADYSARIKTKEIGIRKVFGANVRNIVRLLSKEFIYLLAISVIIAIPLAYLLNQALLGIYERHVPLRIEFFIFGSLLMLVIGFAAVLSQTIKTARAKPVDSLKYE